MKGLILIGLTVLCVACFEQGDCSDVSGNVMQVNFFRFSDKRAIGRELDSVKLIGWDSVMYAGDSVSTISLPVNPAVDELRYVLYYKEAQIDTLHIKYQFQTFALAPECEAIDVIVLHLASAKKLPDVVISQPKITNSVVENIKLYF